MMVVFAEDFVYALSNDLKKGCYVCSGQHVVDGDIANVNFNQRF